MTADSRRGLNMVCPHDVCTRCGLITSCIQELAPNLKRTCFITVSLFTPMPRFTGPVPPKPIERSEQTSRATGCWAQLLLPFQISASICSLIRRTSFAAASKNTIAGCWGNSLNLNSAQVPNTISTPGSASCSFSVLRSII
jgi:hypothetical protein